jgi:glycerol dehydrogenase
MPLLTTTFAGEITLPCVDALLAQAGPFAPELVVGAGGGKTLDAAKAVALALGLPCCTVPTIASTDAPSSCVIALYDEHHAMVEMRKLRRNPELVLVDTAVIAAAPLRFLRAGIGDAISKRFEAEACLRTGAPTLHGAPSSHAGVMAARLCFDLIRRHGPAALASIEAGVPGKDLEALIEATVLLSTMAFENGGLSVAHSISRGIPLLPRAAGSLHGEHVAYGLLVQLVLEGREEKEWRDMLRLYGELGLPRKLAAAGLPDASAAELDQLVAGAMVSPGVQRFDRPLSPADLLDAIARVEAA